MGEPLRIEKWAENLEEVTIGRWLKAEGDLVEAGESVCEIITEKVTFEYEAPLSGRLVRVYAPEKSVVPVGYVIGFISAAGEPPPPDVEEHNRRLLDAHHAKVRLQLDAQAATSGPRGVTAAARVKATPAARRLAREANVSIAEIAKTLGITDRPITPADVQEFLARRGH
ncbi:MAG: E3 binding domain-containing protein [Armatimonadetes bacterium]|nr:E3 binding domain-containing protein [Armatimonadota bacterium]